ncbi:hypothetical protein PILCRDRAFT_1420 [Piloderma croceum F 1598]|uniref:Uncharacterized protein n=1 Tax=Piloderma croceum (strain F 1598) TaxID=765440 RepID=A0A0C3CNF3_PILCF|nr:hypothetical protein PILCRDRAFT_1420 [Piloderma croceum F 1598]
MHRVLNGIGKRWDDITALKLYYQRRAFRALKRFTIYSRHSVAFHFTSSFGNIPSVVVLSIHKHAGWTIIIYLDMVIKCLPDGHDSLLEDARLFIEVIVDGNTIHKTEPLVECFINSRSMEPDPAKPKRLDIKYNKALQLADENVKKPMRPTDVGDLFMECQESFSHDLLERAIAAYEAAVKPTPDDNEDKAELLIRLGLTLGHRFEYFGDIADIGKAICTFERSLVLTPNGDADKPDRLHNLGSSFLTRFEHFGDLADGDRAISIHEQAVNPTPDGHDDKPCYLNDLGESLSRRFEHSGDLADCDRAIFVQEQAVSITPNSDDDKPEYLSNLGNYFLCRFEHSGDLVDVDWAISNH